MKKIGLLLVFIIVFAFHSKAEDENHSESVGHAKFDQKLESDYGLTADQINDLHNVADVVICSKMALWVSSSRRYQIITKCSEFLKKNGILITDVDDYKKSRIIEDLVDFYRYDVPPFLALKKGMRNFLVEYRYRRHGHFRKMMRQFDKESSVKYAQHIMEVWNKLSWDRKFAIKFELLMSNIIYRILPANPKD